MADFRADVDYYEVLQVHPRASDEIIRKAYRTLMLEYGHPDQGGSDERAKQLNQAYGVLKDPERRAAYDRAREAREQAESRRIRSPMVIVTCPRCGQKNRVAQHLVPHSRCGYCKQDFDQVTPPPRPAPRPRPPGG